MLGWYVGLYRLADGGFEPSFSNWLRSDECIARWITAGNGLSRYTDELIVQGKAIGFRANGFPDTYTMQAKDILPVLRTHGPYKNMDSNEIEKFLSKPSTINSQYGFNDSVAGDCHPDEWLVLELWDGG